MDPQNLPDPDLDSIQDDLEPPGALPEEWVAQDEDWSRQIEQQFEADLAGDDEDADEINADGEPSDESPVAPAADDGVEGATAPAAGVTTDPDPNFVQVGDRQLTLDEARRAAELLDWMRSNPEQAVDFARYTEGGYRMVPEGYVPQPQQPVAEQEPAAPQESDEDWAFVPPSLRDAAQKVSELEQRLNWYDQLTAQQQIVQAQEAVEGGVSRFRERHPELDDSIIANLRQTSGQLGIAGRLLQQYGDPVRATEEALEWAFARTDQFRDSLAAEQQRVIEDQKKKNQKMAGIGGTSGSAPRNTRPPATREERDRAAVAELRAAMSGTQ